MTTDKTWFDEILKGNLYLDIGLRVSIWLLIAILTITYASEEMGFSPLAPMQRGFSSLLPVAVNVTRVALILCFLSLLLKDLEHVAPASWGQETVVGQIGGVVRRLAGDLSLWVIGAMVTLFASLLYFAFYAYSSNQWTPDVSRFLITVGMIMIFAISLFSYVNVWVRKKVSFISSHAKLQAAFNTPWKVLTFYGLLLIVTVIAR